MKNTQNVKNKARPMLGFIALPYKQQGATAIEYIIGLVAIVLILLAPIPPGSKNAVELLEEAIKTEHSAYIYASSLPSPKLPSRKKN